MGSNFNFKRVADPVYKTVGLSKLEVSVVNTKVFQRLRNVKQLGLAHLVFPGADYSRFSHSLGVCHVTGRMLEALRASNCNPQIEDREVELYRLAGLLHDIGHYPYSHAMENAVENFYRDKLVVPIPSQSEATRKEENEEDIDKSKFFDHERAGEEVLAKDKEIRDVLINGGFDPDDVSSIFMRSKPRRFSNLVNSDLDADRIDYLLRTAHHSGLPYGSVDLDYIISQMRVDNDGKVCINAKALRATDHMLLCRYFDYVQSTYHKTVTGIELVLESVIMALLENGLISCSRSDVSRMIEQGTWCKFDESCVIEEIRELHRNAGDEVIKAMTESILKRQPPKLVWEKEFLAKRYEPESKDFLKHLLKTARNNRIQWAAQFTIEPERWYIWRKETPLTKVGSLVDVASYRESEIDDKDEYEQAVRVLEAENSATSIPIMSMPHSLMSILSDYSIRMLRIYVLLRPGEIGKREEIRAAIQKSLS